MTIRFGPDSPRPLRTGYLRLISSRPTPPDVIAVDELTIAAFEDQFAVTLPRPSREEMRSYRLLLLASAALSFLALLGAVTACRFAVHHWRGMFWVAGFGVAYLSSLIKPAGRP